MNTRRALVSACTLLVIALAPSLAHAGEADTMSAAPSPPPPPVVVPVSTTTVTSAEPTAAAPERDQTLFQGRVHHGGYGGPESKITTLTGDVAFLLGGQAGWVIDKRLVLGMAGYGLVTTHTPAEQLQSPTGPSRIDLGYGGARAAWIFAPAQLVHFTVGALIGAGGVGVSTKDPSANNGRRSHDAEAFFAFEPQGEVEVNLFRYLRVAASGSFRYLSDTGKPGLHASDLSGPSASLALKIGYF